MSAKANPITIEESKLNELVELRAAVTELSAECNRLVVQKQARMKEARELQAQLAERQQEHETAKTNLDKAMKEMPASVRKLVEASNHAPVKAAPAKDRVTHEDKVQWCVSYLKKQADHRATLTDLNKAYAEAIGRAPGPLRGHLAKAKDTFKVKGSGRQQTVELTS